MEQVRFIERLSSGIEIVHEGPPPEPHGFECWRVHHECAVREIERYRAVMSEFGCETDGGVNDPEGLRFVFERTVDRAKRQDARIGELLRRLGDVCR